MMTTRDFAGPLVAGLLATGLIVACDTSPESTEPPQRLAYGTRDSAGVTIVESRRPAPDSRLGWEVAGEPQVAIGVALGGADYQLYEVGDATRLADGRIVVANGGSDELLVFDDAGNYLAAWAGQGDGPGEFRSLATVHRWAADSLVAADSEQGRMSVFDLDGNHGRTTTLRGEPGGLTKTLPDVGLVEYHVIGVSPAGMLLARAGGGFETQGLWRWDHAYALFGADGRSGVSFGEYPGPETYSESVMEERLVYVVPLRHPFGKTTLTGLWGDLVVFGRNETYEIRAFRSDGSLDRIVRRDHEPASPTQADQDESFRERFAGLDESQRTPRLEVAANVPLVETFPAYSNVKVDALGNLWVAEFKLPDEERDFALWTVFDRTGIALGLVETPPGLTIYEIGEDYILGKRTGDLDVESVEVWELSRREPGS